MEASVQMKRKKEVNDEKISLFNRKVHLLEYSQTHHHILHTFDL